MADSKELGDCGKEPEGAAVATDTGVGAVADTGGRSMGGVAVLPSNQSVLMPRATRTAKATEARMPVRVFGKARAVRERERGGMSAVQGGKRTAL